MKTKALVVLLVLVVIGLASAVVYQSRSLRHSRSQSDTAQVLEKFIRSGTKLNSSISMGVNHPSFRSELIDLKSEFDFVARAWPESKQQEKSQAEALIMMYQVTDTLWARKFDENTRYITAQDFSREILRGVVLGTPGLADEAKTDENGQLYLSATDESIRLLLAECSRRWEKLDRALVAETN